MLKNISYLLCSVFLCTFSLIAVADDPIPEVTVIGKTGDGNGSFLTGRGAQEYLAWATAQAGKSNAGTGSGANSTTVTQSKPANCARDMQFLESDYSDCLAVAEENAPIVYDKCVVVDGRGKDDCMNKTTLTTPGGKARCLAIKEKTLADCK